MGRMKETRSPGVRTCVVVGPETLEAIRVVAIAEDRSISSTTRTLLREALANRARRATRHAQREGGAR